MNLSHLRQYAVARTLCTPVTLPEAIRRLGFVQADPIRAPARAQDLILRHRVKGYRAGDLERRYPALDVEEDFFVNYGFMPRSIQTLMHPRSPRTPWTKARRIKAEQLLAFVRERGVVHPREVDVEFAHGKVRNWFGGSSNATTQLLDAMQYRGLLRVARRAGGVRLFAAREQHGTPMGAAAALDTLVDIVIRKYSPLPSSSLNELINRLQYGVPQWRDHRQAAIDRAKQRYRWARLDGVTWYWPADEDSGSMCGSVSDTVHLVAPFDPLVWDRRRFELLWGWAYRFEAYTPAHQRRLGYYALPLLWRDRVIGWANLSESNGALQSEIGYVGGKPLRNPVFRAALGDELERMQTFLRPREGRAEVSLEPRPGVMQN